ncbi:MAG: nitroreductase family protein [Thermacetogeniaceae bacterium]|jgi:nitroreductase
MNSIFNAPIEEIIKKRVSVRTYTGEPLANEIKEKINDYIATLSNPFNTKVNFKLLESKTAANAAKLGTYGVIKGAVNYIGATIKKQDYALEALGYEFEKLILYITSLGLGSCWLGGTFKKGEFAKAMSVQDDEFFPVISPVGYPSDKKRLVDSIIRFMVHENLRKPWEELFFYKNFSTPLSKSDVGEYWIALEMVRLAPSASNKQPWRIVKDDNLYHFYECKTPGFIKLFGYDIQRIDMGIAACHFHLTAIEKNLNGSFHKLPEGKTDLPDDTSYIFSWVQN